MGLFSKVIKAISQNNNADLKEVNIEKAKFIKDFSMENRQLKELEKLAYKLKDGDKKDKVNKAIYYQKQGLYGEKNVYFELKNTFLPILCLHDIRLKYEEYVAQLDFVVISSRYICVLETKKLNGNIKINSSGEFIRIFNDKNKQGMYSPVSQNRRHINILKYILSKEISKEIDIESLVVMANEKTIIEQKEAPENIKKAIVKYDGIAAKLEELYGKKKPVITLEDMNKIAKILIKYNKTIAYDNVKKFAISKEDYIREEYSKEIKVENIIEEESDEEVNRIFEELRTFRNKEAKKCGYDYKKYHFVFPNSVIEQLIENMPDTLEELHSIKGLGEVKIGKYGQAILKILKGKNVNDGLRAKTAGKEIIKSREQLIDELKKYRLEKSRELGIKPYFIYNNAEMEELVDKKPENKEEMFKVKGFGEKKVESYGEDLLRILKY